jgi:catalase-peroxidase
VPERNCGRTPCRPVELIGEPDVAPSSEDPSASPSRIWYRPPESGRQLRGTGQRAPTGRIRLEPQKTGSQRALARLAKLEGWVQQDFNKSEARRRSRWADLTVLGGCAAVEEAAKKAGHNVTVPFAPGRTEPRSSRRTHFRGSSRPATFRNYLRKGDLLSPETRLLDRANLRQLTAPR